MSKAPEHRPSRFESVIEGIEKVDLTGFLSLAVALLAGAVALGRRLVAFGRRLVGAVRRRG